MSGAEVIATYEAIWALTRRMRGAAGDSQWDELISLENERYVLVKKLMAGDDGDLSDVALNDRKAELIRNILDCDAETRSLSEAWMGELRQILNSVGTEKKLSNAYAAFE